MMDFQYNSISALSANTFPSDQLEMIANNVSNVHVSPDVLSTLLLLQQGNVYKLQQKILHGISRSSYPEVF